MIKNKIDKVLINELTKLSLNDGFGELERRDYILLEEKNPERLKGKSKSAGIMFLLDLGNEYYITISLYDDEVRFVFRFNDNSIISRRVNFDNFDIFLHFYIEIVNSYRRMLMLTREFNRGKIPTSVLRNQVLEQILK